MIKPGILERNFAALEKKVKLVEDISPIIHIDIVDGLFVPGLTVLDVDKVDEIVTPSQLELHLMVENPSSFVRETFVNVVRIISQIEANNISGFIEKCEMLLLHL